MTPRKTAAKSDPPAEPTVDSASASGPDPASSEPVARFSSRTHGRTVEMDGRFYELRSLSDYGIGAQQRLSRDGREFGQLWNSDEDLTDAQQKRLKFLLDRIFDGDQAVPALLEASKTVRRAFNDAARSELVLDFIYAPLRKMMAAAVAAETTDTEAEAGVSASITTS